MPCITLSTWSGGLLDASDSGTIGLTVAMERGFSFRGNDRVVVLQMLGAVFLIGGARKILGRLGAMYKS